VKFASNPEIDRAQLVWHFGPVQHAGTLFYDDYEKKDLLGQYVRVKIPATADDPIYWYGIVVDNARVRGGTQSHDQLVGDQKLSAIGLDLLLDRTIIDTSTVETAAAPNEKTVRRGLTFNEKNKFDNEGNRSTAPGPNGTYLFARDLTAADYWSSLDICQYLLQYHPPSDVADETRFTWKLSSRAVDCIPTWDRPVVRTHGRSVRQILNQLFDRRRLLGWRLNVNSNNEIELDVYSFNADALTLPGGDVQQPNPTQWNLPFDAAIDPAQILKDSDDHRVDQVVIRGERKTTTISLADSDGTLERDWATADETAYESGPSGLAGDVDEDENRVNQFRARDALKRVFSYFRLPDDWDGLVADGEGGAASAAFPADERYGAETYFLPALRFARKLPKELLGIVDSPTGSPNETLPPFALFRVTDDGTTRYQYSDRLNANAENELAGNGNGRPWAASMKIQPDAPGIILKVSGKDAKPHLLAATDFSGLSYDEDADLDWRYMIVTVTLVLDSQVEAVWPADGDLDPVPDVVRRVVIDLSGKDRYRLDYLHDGAVLSVDDAGDLERKSDYGFDDYIRDDTDAMEDLARFIYEWYAVTRQAFTLKVAQIYDGVEIGDLIYEIGTGDDVEEVRSIVTSIRHDLLKGDSTITTSYAELDYSAFA